MMAKVYWLTPEEINITVNALSSYCETHDNPVIRNILKELGVAQARAESNRLLGLRFKKSIGKRIEQIPVKLKSDEIMTIEQSELNITVKGLFYNDIH